jgi:alcohol dehydrogenase
MVAGALGATVIAVDVKDEALRLARKSGAAHAINASDVANVPAAIYDLTGRGAHVSLDALGSGETAGNSLHCLRKRGRHVQVGLLAGEQAQPRLPMELVIARELEIFGSHGLAAADYAGLLSLASAGALQPLRLIGRRITLDEAPAALVDAGRFAHQGITVIEIPG